MFLEAQKCAQSTKAGNAVFLTSKGGVDIPCRTIADPSYSQTFKRLFTWDNNSSDVSGKLRVQSLLNSIFYPQAGENGFKIREIEALSDEIATNDRKTPLGVLKFDVVYECTCYIVGHEKETKIFDVEMQTAYEARFSDRLFDNASALRLSNHCHVVILAFLNYLKSYDSSSWLGLFSKDQKTGLPLAPVLNVVDTLCVDLSKKALLLNNGSPIVIGAQTLGISGREWLKLLSLRHWATPHENRYVIPKEQATDPAVESALEILQSVDNAELNYFIAEEKSAVGLLEGVAEEIAETMISTSEMTDDQISGFVKLPVDRIRELRKKINK